MQYALQHIPGDTAFWMRFIPLPLTLRAGEPLITTYNWPFADYWMASNCSADTCHWATIGAPGRQRPGLYDSAGANNSTFSRLSNDMWSPFVMGHYWIITHHSVDTSFAQLNYYPIFLLFWINKCTILLYYITLLLPEVKLHETTDETYFKQIYRYCLFSFVVHSSIGELFPLETSLL